MRLTIRKLGFFLIVFLAGPALLPAAPPAQKPIRLKDMLAWKTIRTSAVSPDGRWFAYLLAPNEGDAHVVVRRTQGDREYRFAVGEPPRFGGGAVVFSEDSRWLAFTVHHPRKEALALQKQHRPARNKAALVDLTTGSKAAFDDVRSFHFSGEAATWIALHKYPAPGPALGLDRPVGPDALLREPGAGPDRPSGSDLLLHELATGNELNLGNVAEFAFDKKGRWLALAIDAAGQAGNGIQLRDMTTAALVPLDTAKAVYRHLHWTEKGDGLSVLRGTEDKEAKQKVYAVVGFSGFAAGTPHKTVYDPKAEPSFPAGMVISANRPANWTEDLGGLLFGIQEKPKKKSAPAAPKSGPRPDKPVTVQAAAATPTNGQADRNKPMPMPTVQPVPTRTPTKTPPAPKTASPDEPEPEKPDVVIWHWADDRLQSEQQMSAGRDRNYTYLCLYRVQEKKFHRLADDSLRTVTPAPKERWAVGYDDRAYRLMTSLDGRDFRDVYVVDLHTGERRLALKRNRWPTLPSPDGTHFLFYDDGHWYTYDMAAAHTHNITRTAPTSFVNDEDDHNVQKPPRFPVGWAKDGARVLLSDGWDIWSIPVHGGKAVNLSGDGKAQSIRYQRPFVLDPEEKGIDLSRPLYVAVYGEWTKKAGIARIDPDKSGAKRLLWDDANFGTLLKAKKADVYLYTRDTHTDYPDYYVSDATLGHARRLTHANPQQDQYRWSAGSILVNYTSAKGKKLQAALFLPAGYEENKRYPTIVYIYERLSQGLNRYDVPRPMGFSMSAYTSNGYAVLMPDIHYEVNDPGRSAVWCVLPALEAAIATGVVDRERVGLHGHSWGGYQTAFLITQTDAFRAAAAGAPLTDLISMYSSIYWNIGIANQPIFESSQGRFTRGYWDDVDAYIRNSPVYHAKNVKTPLLLLHNDKDGAVDWNQGIEYFNALRRLRKPVVWLQYRGENHGLAKPANQKDYTLRMREFFDHYLRDRAARRWLTEGVPHLKLEEHLQERLSQNAEE